MKIISVFGARGGVGATTFASNLSALLASRARTELVNLAREGDVAYLSGRGVERRDIAGVDASVEYVVADCGTLLNDRTMGILKRSSLVIVAIDSSPLSVFSAEHALREFTRAFIPKDRTVVAAVRWEESGVLPKGSVAVRLKKDCAVFLPASLDVAVALQLGRPLVDYQPRHRYMQALSKFADDFIFNGSVAVSACVQAPECADPAAVRDEVIERLQKKADLNSSHTRDEVRGIVAGIMGEMSASIKGLDKEALLKDVLNEALGLGPIEELICRDDITEVMINSTKDVFIERAGRVERARVSFTGEKQLKRIIDRMVAFSGRRVDESSPMVDARLRNGFRLNVVLPPVSVAGPVVTIRKFRSAPMTMEDLLKNGSVSNEQAAMLKEAVLKRQNICVSGGTGSGKTTLLNVLSSFIPEGERIITIEDSAELKLLQGHVISLESRPANIEGKGMVTIRDLVRNALRMRPDRIIVGECRGGEALDMLQAMNTGHDGSLTTIHANSPRDMILRLETLVMFSGFDLPSRAIREQIASAINLLVHVEREEGGSRRVASICRVRGLEDGQIVVEEDTVV